MLTLRRNMLQFKIVIKIRGIAEELIQGSKEKNIMSVSESANIQGKNDSLNEAHPIEMLINLKREGDKDVSIGREFLNAEQIEILKSNWITTIEEFLAIISQEEGRKGIKALLKNELIDFSCISESICGLIGKDRFKELTQENRGGSLGALFEHPPDSTATNNRPV